MNQKIQDYIDRLDASRKEPFIKLVEPVEKNLPSGFTSSFGYGMPGFSVSHSIYPAGYHVDPSLPLPFIGLASQKNFIALYHMGIYGDANLLAWFQTNYPKHAKSKLDMGKSCIRFKKLDDIPFDLIAELCTKITVQDYIANYEKILNR